MKALLKELGLAVAGLLIPVARALEATAMLVLMMALYGFGVFLAWWFCMKG